MQKCNSRPMKRKSSSPLNAVMKDLESSKIPFIGLLHRNILWLYDIQEQSRQARLTGQKLFYEYPPFLRGGCS